MKLSFKDQRTETLLYHRRLLGGVSGCLVLANLLLGMILITRSERWILIPQFDSDRRMALTAGTFSEAYLREWAMSLCEDLLTANPHTVAVKKDRFLQIAAQPQGAIQKTLSEMVQVIQRDGASTAFYPKTTQVTVATTTVLVRGTFFVYLGRDHRPVVRERTFRVTGRRGPHGVLLVKSLAEVGGTP